MRRRGKKQRLEIKLRHMLLSILIPITILFLILLMLFGKYANDYNRLSQNLAISSEFNLTFKDKIDLEMYYVAVGSSYQDEFPVGYVEDALDTVAKLKTGTSNEESKKSLEHLENYLNNLKKRMYELVEMKEDGSATYDELMNFLEGNIRTITRLVTEEVQTYIYSESMNLTEVEAGLMQNVRLLLFIMGLLLCFAVGVLLYRAFKFSASVTEPVTGILMNVRKVGKGDFNLYPVHTDNLEMEEMDAGIHRMAKKIENLLENVKKEQDQKHLTELQLLQAQVSPHFLYNTLDTIVWLIEGGQQEEALDMIDNLSVFFRTSLSKGNDIIPLSEEIKHTLSYLEIQQSRYKDIMEFEIRIPESFNSVMVPKLTLQPLAENALYHGLKNKREKGKILIEGFENGEDLILRVTDTGQGMSPERLKEVQESIDTGKRDGFGLTAVQERIVLYYGEGYGMKLSSEEGVGTVIELRLAEKIQLKS